MSAKTKRLLRNFLIEIIIYCVLLVIYFLVVLQFLGQPLNQLFHLNPVIYAGATLFLIVAQGVALEIITSLLIKWLGLDKLD